MAVKQTTIKTDDAMQQRKTFYRALSQNVQSVLFFWHGVALFFFAMCLGWWARGDLETQKNQAITHDLIQVQNVILAQIKAKDIKINPELIKEIKEKTKELKK